MAGQQKRPLTYLITSGATNSLTTRASKEFQNIIGQAEAAARAGISLFQLREKSLSVRLVYILACECVSVTRGSNTLVLVNDRADIAAAAGAAGVHLSTRSVSPAAIRSVFGGQLIVGVSTHSLEEASRAHREGADFATFGPVFETASKSVYGPAVGLGQLARVASALSPFPLIALGGLSTERVETCLRAGAAGVAGISMFATIQNMEVGLATSEAVWRDNAGNKC